MAGFNGTRLKIVRDVFVPTYKQTADPVQMTSYTFKGNEFQNYPAKSRKALKSKNFLHLFLCLVVIKLLTFLEESLIRTPKVKIEKLKECFCLIFGSSEIRS